MSRRNLLRRARGASTSGSAGQPHAPTNVVSISPLYGTVDGATAVTITVGNSAFVTSAKIGGVAVTSLVIASPTTITCVTGAHAAGKALTATVTNTSGTSAAGGSFDYIGPLTVVSISPATGSTVGSEPVTVTVDDTESAFLVYIGSNPCTSFAITGPTTITCLTPAAGAGSAVVSVYNAWGGTSGPPTFTYSTPVVGTNPNTLAMTCLVDGGDYIYSALGSSSWPLITTVGVKAMTDFTGPGALLNPTVGATLNSIPSVAFTRATLQYLNTSTAGTAFLTTGAWSYWDIVFINSEANNKALSAFYDNDSVLYDGAGNWSMAQSSTGPQFQAGTNNGATNGGSGTNFTNGVWVMRQARYDGTNIETRINSGAWTVVARTPCTDITGTVFVGSNYNSTKFLDGLVMVIATSKLRFNDATFDAVKDYYNARFGTAF